MTTVEQTTAMTASTPGASRRAARGSRRRRFSGATRLSAQPYRFKLPDRTANRPSSAAPEIAKRVFKSATQSHHLESAAKLQSLKYRSQHRPHRSRARDQSRSSSHVNASTKTVPPACGSEHKSPWWKHILQAEKRLIATDENQELPRIGSSQIDCLDNWHDKTVYLAAEEVAGALTPCQNDEWDAESECEVSLAMRGE